MKTQATQPKVQETIQPKSEKQASIDTILAGYSSPLQRKVPDEEEPLQKKENNTGLPDNLKSGVESLSGIGLDDVKVHYNSSEPAQLQAHAYAQGTNIHVAPGQEKHLPHEAWHVVQQKQGRVKPTVQMKGKVNVNDDEGLETEADVMGAKAMTQLKESCNTQALSSPDKNVVQAKFVRVIFNQEPPGKKGVMPVTPPSVSSKAPSEESPIVEEETPTPSKAVASGLKPSVPEASSLALTPVKGPVLEADDDNEGMMMLPPPPQTYKVETADDMLELINASGLLADKDEANKKFIIKKLAEGPDILFHDTISLNFRISTLLKNNTKGLTIGKGDADAKKWRKINRIAGQIQEKCSKPFGPPDTQEIRKEIMQCCGKIMGMVWGSEVDMTDPILEQIGKILDMIIDRLSGIGSRFMWHIYDIISHFGPLANLLDNEDKYKPEILVSLRDIRQLMAKNQDVTPTVVAHRGTGPTNRTMGGLIAQNDNRRTTRKAENSPDAFNEAFKSVPGQVNDAEEESLGKLDGVECDVYLSSDGIPFLSHEGSVKEQLITTRQAIHNALLSKPDNVDGKEVHELTADQLKTIQRNDSAGSNFMTLNDLLEMSVPVAYAYYYKIGKAFRVEVEMKGAKVKADPHNEKIGPQNIKINTAKVISKFHKKYPGLPIEIILFNGDAGQVEEYSKLRTEKTALGGMLTGLGTNPQDLLKSKGREKVPGKKAKAIQPDATIFGSYIDELRYQFTAEFNKNSFENDIPNIEFANHFLENFIVTLVFGQETAPGMDNLKSVEPNKPLLAQDKPNLHDAAFDKNIEKALVAYASDTKNFEKLKKLHILTDYPQKAKFLKDALFAASQQAIENAEL